MSATTTTKTIDLDALRTEAEQRLQGLREQAQRMAPEALADSKAAAALETVEGEIDAMQARLARIINAAGEQERRAVEAEIKLEEERKAAHRVRARECWAQAPKIAAEADAALAEAMATLKRHDENLLEMEREAQAGGGHATIPVKSAIQAALTFAVDAARLQRGMVIVEPPAPKACLLVESLPASQGFEGEES